MKRIISGLQYVTRLVFCYLKYRPYFLVFLLRDYFFLRLILGIKKDITLSIGTLEITGPNEFHFLYTTSEVFFWKLYKKLHGCNHILDIGGYMGESALGFSLENKYVTTFEPSIDNFKYLAQNIIQKRNIIAYNKAIVIDNMKEFYYEGERYTPGGHITTIKNGNEPTPSISIKNFLKEDIDGIKMDIEGFEYEIIQYFIEQGNIPFLKGYIEFHHLLDVKKLNLCNNFCDYLLKRNYHIEFEDIYGKPLKRIGGSDTEVLFFSKIT